MIVTPLLPLVVFLCTSTKLELVSVLLVNNSYAVCGWESTLKSSTEHCLHQAPIIIQTYFF